jgi:hydrogenase/urease accessory protein HupE
MMPLTLALIAIGAFFRLVPHPDNMVPMAAIALYAAARLPRRWAVVVPLAAILLSDVAIDVSHSYPFYFTSRLTTYAFFTLLVALGWLVPRQAGMPARIGAAVAGSTLFFVLSNFAVWIGGEGYSYPMTLGGLLSTYAAGLPFYRNGLIADVAGTVVLFGLDGVLARWFEPKPAKATVEVTE